MDAQYDEFGNYIGPEMRDSDDESELSELFENDEQLMEVDDTTNDEQQENAYAMAIRTEQNKIILHEDKKYYPNSDEVYPGVRAVTLDEDAQELETPLISKIKIKNFSVLEKEPPTLIYSVDFMTGLMKNPALIRNIAVLGHFHHGKTLLMDTLISSTQERMWDPSDETRYTDTRKDEQQRGLSIKATPVSLVLEDIQGKSFLLNMLDCPGHTNFLDEANAAVSVCDGVVIIVDAMEGVMLVTEKHIQLAISMQLPISIVINKMDRLILELKLPPADAYFKLMQILEEINNLIHTYSTATSTATSTQQYVYPRISPELENVCFAAGQHGWSFSLLSFAHMYSAKHPQVDPNALAKRLWGDVYYNEDTKTFSKKKTSAAASRTFVQFILEPIYKIYSQVIGETPKDLAVTLKKLGIKLTSTEIHLDPKPLLRVCLSRYLGYPRGLVQMLVQHTPNPTTRLTSTLPLVYTGSLTTHVASAMLKCDSEGPLMVHVSKLYNSPDGNKFLALGRIYSGTLKQGHQVRVLGESFSEHDDEDQAMATVSSIAISVGRFSIEIPSATAGNWVLIDGIDQSIKKCATVTDISHNHSDVSIFNGHNKLANNSSTTAVVRLAVEPYLPAELPKMIEALRRVSKSYPSITTKVEESGEHVLMATGELAMDCAMHDLRHLYSDIEVKVSDPVVSFCETVVETSSVKCFSETPNKKNRLGMLAEPMDTNLAFDIEHGKVNLKWGKKTISNFFTGEYKWDLLAARSVWAFGPDNDFGPNLLLDDTLPSEVDRGLLNTIRESVIQGFKWGCREGPLADEPIRNVKFKILDATISKAAIYRGGGQVIPTARRVVYSSFLMAAPRLMEPIYLVEVQAPADTIQAVYPVLARRRGHIVQDSPKPGAPFYTLKAYIPVMDSFGFETDLRSYTQGQAFCLQVFDHWAVVPGDPLDKNIILHPLEPSPPPALARDFMTKTRRRKGLSEDVSIGKYFDDPMLLDMARQEAEHAALY